MSWDVLLFRLPADITSSKDIPADYSPPPLGTPQDVGAAVRAAVPGVDLSDPAWGELVGPAGWHAFQEYRDRVLGTSG